MSCALRSYFRRLAEGYEHGVASQLLKPVLGIASNVYEELTRQHRRLYDTQVLQRTKLPFPVISVGNITWGGTGKTPFVEYLARKFSDFHKTPLVLTRGYSHDEVAQFKHHLPGVVLGVGKNRTEVAKAMAKQQPVDLAILDDGFQHWPLERDLEIALVNALNPFGNGKVIPQGILREPVTALKRASVVMISHCNLVLPAELKKLREKISEVAPKAFLVESYLEPLFFYRAKNRDRVMLTKLQNHKVTTFSGVGTPISFQKLLSSIQVKPVLNFEFTDHHEFTKKELEEIKKASQVKGLEEIITTEKDFYRCASLMTQVLNPLILATRLRIKSGEEVLNEKLFRLVGVNRK
ncbi:MAG: tetraacyldisaccharide 4'-kinase [Candidatus Omnitrophica bacterium]|nr:tetraacyldisaccharide 4'-kinase [Candidatus Omnitrophota bacterium]